MKILTTFILLFIVLLAKAQESKETILTQEEKIYGLSYIWQEVNYNFAYLNNYNLDWDSVYVSNIPKVIEAKSLFEYYEILSKIMNYFHEGHTTIDFPDEIKEGDYYGNIAISCFYSKGNFYVKAFGKEFENQIDLGSKIIEINSQEPNTYFQEYVFPKYGIAAHCASSYIAKGKLFEGLLNEKLHVKFQNTDGKFDELDINRKPIREERVYSSKCPEMFPDSVFVFKQIGGVSYVRLGTFENGKSMSGFIQNIDSIKDSNGVIIDLRNNSGGNSQFATEIVKHFSGQEKFKLWYGLSKINSSSSRAVSMYPRLKTDTALQMQNYYKYYADYATFSKFSGGQYEVENNTDGELKEIPVVILTNEHTASSGESFIVQMKQVKKVTVIGEPTYGSITTPLIIPLPGGGSAWIGSRVAQDEDGNPYSYTMPDILYQPTVDEVIHGNDQCLEIALEYLDKKLRMSKRGFDY